MAVDAKTQEIFLSCELREILVGEPLPCALYLHIDFRFITFRAQDDVIDRMAFDRLVLKKVRTLFLKERDRPAFTKWSEARLKEKISPPIPKELAGLAKAREDVHRKMYDIFQSEHPDRLLGQTLNSSKKLVTEVMKYPYAVQSLAHLQTYSQGTVDHCINVSVLAVYLAMQMGYTHTLILQHVGMGALLHDLGKSKIETSDGDSDEVVAQKMADHPEVGFKMLETQARVPNEVKLIVLQHHEHHDGSGYPKKLRGSGIYDLSRIVSIANAFDGQVADAKGTLVERQRHAVHQLDQVLFKQFDPQKLDKALKILKMGI